LVDEVLRHIGSRANTLTQVEVLLHALITNLVVLVKVVEKTVFTRGVTNLTLIGDGVFSLRLVSVRSRRFLTFLDAKEVRFITESKGNLIDFVGRARLLGLILDGHLLLQPA
jgi:hypothetical protein